jgi:hypothetical protein
MRWLPYNQMIFTYSKSVFDKIKKIIIINPMQSSITLKGKDTMSNYTEQMIAKISAAQPLDLEKAKALASDFGLSHRSVISKAKSLGFEYISQPKRVASKRTGPTKADVLTGIRSALSLADREGDLTKDELVAVFEHLS